MKVEFTWPDYIIPLVAPGASGENIIDLFINSILLENDDDSPRRMTRAVVDLTRDGVPLWRWELPLTALSSHLEVDAAIAEYDMSEREQLVGTHLAPKIQNLAQGAMLQPGEQAILRRFPIRFTSRYVPDKIVLRIYSGQNLIGRNGIRLNAMASLNQYHFPVEGVWQVSKNFDFTLSHRQSATQEFAVDLFQVSDNGTIMDGKTGTAEDFVCFRKPVRAMAGGEVNFQENRVPNNVPGESITGTDLKSRIREYGFISAIKGNGVQIKHDDGTFSFYSHLHPGSVTVKCGDTIEAGQVFAEIGNSGVSTKAHLHLQLNDGPNPLGNRSLPLAFNNLFDIHGKPLPVITQNFSMVHTGK